MSEQEPSPRELDVLKALWALGSGSVREVHRRMCPDGELAFNTVQTVLRIMEEKGLVRHRALGRTFISADDYAEAEAPELDAADQEADRKRQEDRQLRIAPQRVYEVVDGPLLCARSVTATGSWRNSRTP